MTKPDITRDKTFKVLPGTMPSEDTGVVPAYYPYPRKIKDAGDEVLLEAGWGQSEGTRQTNGEFSESPALGKR